MIEFLGNISKDCKKYIINKEVNLSKKISIIISFISLIPIILLALFEDWIYTLFIPVVLLYVFLNSINTKEKNYESIFPYKITIDKEKITSISKKHFIVKSINDVKEVVDMGTYYVLKTGKNSNMFVCDKSLLKNGTIDDFQMVFNGKIQKRIKDIKQ